MNIAENALESLRDLLPSVEITTAKFREALKNLNQQIGILQKERQRLVTLPLSASDVEALLHAQIDKEADSYRKFAAQGLKQSLLHIKTGTKPKNRHAAIDANKFLVDGMRAYYSGFLGGIRDASPGSSMPYDKGSERLTQAAASFFFRAEMKRGASEIVAAMDYPFTDAISLSQVKADLERIDSELKELISAHDELVSQAKAHGIAVTETSESDIEAELRSLDTFDGAGWIVGETGGDPGEEFILFYYRWPNGLDDRVALDGKNVIFRDTTTGREGSKPWSLLNNRVKQDLGAPAGLGHLPEFANIRRR